MDHWLQKLKNTLTRKTFRDPFTPPDPARSGKDPGFRLRLRNLIPFAMKHRRKGFLGLALVAAASALSFPQPLIAKYLIDEVILARNPGLLALPLLLLVVVSAAAALLEFLRQPYFTRLEQSVILDIQEHVLERALRFPKSFFDRSETGYIVSRLSADVQGLSWFFSESIPYVLENIAKLAGGLILLFYLEWRLALAGLIVVPAVLFTVRYFSRVLYALSHAGMERQANVLSRFQEAINSISLIKSFNSERRTARHLVSELKSAQEVQFEQSLIGSLAQFAVRAIPGAVRVMVLAVGAWWIMAGEWTLGSLIAFQAYLGYVFGPAQFLASAGLEVQNARASLERVSAVFDMLPEDNTGTGRAVEKLGGEIEFRDVTFGYATGEPVLDRVSFHIRPGQQVALMGPSGIGKTTLMGLLLRFYKPQAGEIYFDGHPLSELEVGSLRRRIGYVSQKEILLAGTIKENLLYGNPEASEEDVVRAAKTAGVHDFISGLKEGYGEKIDEKGGNLSEGQIQRLAIARALVKNPDILLLDEPSSALDGIAERSFFQALPGAVPGKTVFLITHRPGLARYADLILLLNEDRLVAAGTHDSLSRESRYYREFGSSSSDTLS